MVSCASVALLLNSSQRHPGMILLPVLIASAYFIHVRLPASAILAWTIRAIAMGLILFTAPEPRSMRYWYFDPASVATVGMLLQAELLVRHYLPRLNSRQLGIMLSLTAGILTAGSITLDGRVFAIVAPLYTLCALGVLRSFRPPVATSPALAPVQAIRSGRRWFLHGSATFMALLAGLGIASVMLPAYRQFGGATVGLLMQWLPARTTGGISGNERLTSSWDVASSTGRTLKIEGTNQAMHLRGLAFDTYFHGQWMPMFVNRPLENAGLLPSLPEGKRISVERLQDELNILYMPLETAGFDTPPRSTNLIERGHRKVVQSVTESGETMVYQFVLPARPAHTGPIDVTPTREELETCLGVPEEIEPGVRDIAATLRRDTQRQQVAAIVGYLQDNHQYSLTSRFDRRDPVSDFLLNKKAAHCQFFASSAVILLRLNGIPARYVTGYFAHEATSDQSMVVRGRDAHAWVEAWLDGVGWVTVEATPASGTPPALGGEVGWYQKLKDLVGDLLAAFGKFMSSLGWPHLTIAAATILFTAFVLQMYRTWRARRTRPRLRAYAFPRAEYQRLATEFEMLLKRLGDPPPGSSTWHEHLKSETAQHHRAGRRAQFDAAIAFVDAYNRNRFGRPDDPQAIRELDVLLKQVKEK